MNEAGGIMEVLIKYKAFIIIIVLVLFVINNSLRKTKIYQEYKKNKKRRGLIEAFLLLGLAIGIIFYFINRILWDNSQQTRDERDKTRNETV